MEFEKNERDFKGVWIPKEVWLDERLNALDKCIFVEIDSLDSEEKGCFASNKYLAEFCQCSETKVSNAITKLIKLGYLYLKSFDGRQRILKSRFTKNAEQIYKNCKADLQNSQENNIYNNKKNNKDNNNIYIEKAEQVLDYLNEKAGTRFKAIESNTKFIKARLKDYTEEDLKSVIDKKVKEWKGTEFQKYLRPETLFNATKFESYINGLEKGNKPNSKNSAVIRQREYSKEELNNVFNNIDDFI